MKHNEGCSRLRRVALVLATIWLSGCATVSSDSSGPGACPPVVGYSGEFQARAAEALIRASVTAIASAKLVVRNSGT